MGVFVPLKDIADYSNRKVGQKALLLGQKAVAVPFSLVITSDVYDAFVEHNGLQADMNVLFNNIELDTKSLVRSFNEIAPRFMEGNFPAEVSNSLRECFELLCLDTQSLDVLHGKPTKHTVLSLRRSTSYNDQDIQNPGLVFTKDDLDDFLNSVKAVFLSAFTPSSVVRRNQQKITDFTTAIVVTRLPNITTCFEASHIVDQKKLFVSSYVGFIDRAKSVTRDFFDIGVEFLKINKQNIAKQHRVVLYDLKANKAVAKEHAGLSQSATEQTILEVARLTKKIATEFSLNSVMVDFVMDDENKIYLSDVWSSKDVEHLPEEKEEPVELEEVPLENLRNAVIAFLKENKFSAYGDSINIILRSLETDRSLQTLEQGLLLCKEIINN